MFFIILCFFSNESSKGSGKSVKILVYSLLGLMLKYLIILLVSKNRKKKKNYFNRGKNYYIWRWIDIVFLSFKLYLFLMLVNVGLSYLND